MTDGNLLIEKLLGHAKAHLELSDYDLPCKRSLLKHVLRVDDQTDVNFEQAVDSQALKSELISYALEKGLTHNDSTSGFASFVMGLLSPLPSAVNKKFRTMREQFGANSACEYLYSLSIGAWGIDGRLFNEKIKPYHQNGAFELLLADKPDSAETFVSKTTMDCNACVDTLRSVSLSLNDTECILQYANPTSRDEECHVCSQDGQALLSFESRVIAMLDFIEYIPDYSISSTNDPKFSACTTTPTFIAGKFTPLAFTQKPDFSLSCNAYHDVEISLFHQINCGVRLQSFNRNTLERLAGEILTAWHTYREPSASALEVQTQQNYSSVLVRYTQDGRYCVDIVLTSNKNRGEDKPLSAFDRLLNVESLFGRVVLKEDFNDALKMISAVLTKKIPLDSSLFGERATLHGYEAFVNGLTESLGYFKDEQKALKQIKTAVFEACQKAVASNSPFTFDDDGTRGFRIFLAGVDVK